ERVINNLERLYSLWGKGDLVDALVSMGGHDYRQDIRQGAFRFMNTHLKNDPWPVTDSEVDLVTGPRETIHPIEPEQLRVFPSDSDIPKDARNGSIDQDFVPMAKVPAPKEGEFDFWKRTLVEKLRRLTFHHFPERIPAAEEKTSDGKNLTGIQWLKTEPGISIRLKNERSARGPEVVLVVASENLTSPIPDSIQRQLGENN